MLVCLSLQRPESYNLAPSHASPSLNVLPTADPRDNSQSKPTLAEKTTGRQVHGRCITLCQEKPLDQCRPKQSMVHARGGLTWFSGQASARLHSAPAAAQHMGTGPRSSMSTRGPRASCVAMVSAWAGPLLGQNASACSAPAAAACCCRLPGAHHRRSGSMPSGKVQHGCGGFQGTAEAAKLNVPF